MACDTISLLQTRLEYLPLQKNLQLFNVLMSVKLFHFLITVILNSVVRFDNIERSLTPLSLLSNNSCICFRRSYNFFILDLNLQTVTDLLHVTTIITFLLSSYKHHQHVTRNISSSSSSLLSS